MNWLTIAVIVILVLSVIIGCMRGFVRMAISCLATIITLVIVVAASPYVKDYVKEHTPIYDKIEQGVSAFVEENLKNSLESMTKTQEDSVITELPLPKSIQNILIENNQAEKYKEMGVSHFTEYISQFLANMAFSVLIYVAMFIIIWLILKIVLSLLNVITALPVIHQINALAGGAFGLINGLIFIWTGCMVITAMSATDFGINSLVMIQESPFLSFLYNNNLLLQMIMGMIRSF